MANILKILVGVPAYGGQVTAHQIRMWMEFGNTIGASPERFELVGVMFADINGIDRARNFLLAAAMQAGADWLLMIDADTWVEFEAEQADAGFQLLRMISDGDRAGATIIGAPVARRDHTKAHELMCYQLHPMYKDRQTEVNSLDAVRLDDLGKGVQPIDAIATAVFALNITKVGELTFKAPAHLGELGEDLDFCRQVREAGGKILCDTRVNTRHLSRPIALRPTP